MLNICVLEKAKVHKKFFSLVLILLAVFQLHAQEKNNGDISFETDSMGLISVTIQKTYLNPDYKPWAEGVKSIHHRRFG